jgi:hypothetical protein
MRNLLKSPMRVISILTCVILVSWTATTVYVYRPLDRWASEPETKHYQFMRILKEVSEGTISILRKRWRFPEPALEVRDGDYIFEYYPQENNPADGTYLAKCFQPGETKGVAPLFINAARLPIDATEPFHRQFTKHAHTPPHEMFHAIQSHTRYKKDIFKAYQEGPIFSSPSCGSLWVNEGSAVAVGYEAARLHLGLSKREYSDMAKESNYIAGSRRYDFPFFLEDPTLYNLSDDNWQIYSYLTSSFFRWLGEEYAYKEGVERSPNLSYLKDFFSRARSDFGEAKKDPASTKWLHENLKKMGPQGVHGGLFWSLPDFYPRMAGYGDRYLLRRDQYSRTVKRYAGVGKYKGNGRSSDYVEAVFGECEKIALTPESSSGFAIIRVADFAAGCVEIDRSELLSPEITITMEVDKVNALTDLTERSDEMDKYHIGWGGFSRYAIKKVLNQKLNTVYKLYNVDLRKKVFKDKTKVRLIVSKVPSDINDTLIWAQRSTIKISAGYTTATVDGPTQELKNLPTPESENSTNQLPGTAEFLNKNPLPTSSGDEKLGLGSTQAMMNVEKFNVSGDCLPSTGDLCLKNQMTLTLTAGVTGYSIYSSDFDEKQTIIIPPPNLGNLYLPQGVVLRIPNIPKGFSGSLEKVGISWGQIVNGDNLSYEALTANDIDPSTNVYHGLTGKVTIEEYSDTVLRGSYSAKLFDPYDPDENNVLPAKGSVSGSFSIFFPHALEEELSHTLPDRFSTERISEVLFPNFEMPRQFYLETLKGYKETLSEQIQSWNNQRTYETGTTVPVPTFTPRTPGQCTCSCEEFRAGPPSECLMLCQERYRQCLPGNGDFSGYTDEQLNAAYRAKLEEQFAGMPDVLRETLLAEAMSKFVPLPRAQKIAVLRALSGQ